MGERSTIAAILATLAACSDLTRLPADSCGNTVVEDGEDCDQFVDPALGDGLVCAGCRYVCSAEEAVCPVGWGCGPDGTCVHGTGQYQPAPGSPFPLEARQWQTGDVDGDGRADLIGVQVDEIRLLLGDPDGALRAGRGYRAGVAPSGDVVAGDLDLDGRTDLMVPTALGVAVLRGQVDGTLSPVPYSPYRIESFTAARVVPVRAAGHLPEHSMLVVGSGDVTRPPGSVSLVVVPVPAVPTLNRVEFGGPASVADLGDRIPVADVDGDGVDEFALVWPGDDTIRVFGTVPSFLNNQPVAIERLSIWLPTPPAPQAAHFADVDGDGFVDLIVQLEDEAVLVGRGDGTAALDPLAGLEVDPRFTGLGTLLAVGDVNADGRADCVTPTGVYLAGTDGFVRAYRPLPEGSRYLAASIADLDDDDTGDIAVSMATPAMPSTIHVLRSSAFGFQDVWYSTGGEPFALRTGDHDGDDVSDLVYAVRGPAGDELHTVYGERSGPFTGPVPLARFGGIAHFEPARLRGRDTLDTAEDLIISLRPGPSDELPLAVFAGSALRAMASTFQADSAPTASPSTPGRLAIGRLFGGAEPDWIATAGSTVGTRLWLVAGAPGAAYRTEQSSVLATSAVPGLAAGEPDVVAAADVDGDGRDELLCLSGDDGPMLTTIRVSGPVDDPVLSPTSTALQGDGPARRLALADVDRDGADDLLIIADQRVALHGGGGGEFAPVPLEAAATDAIVIDADGDATRELVLLRDGEVVIADPAAAPAMALEERATGIAVPGAVRLLGADIDGDGLSDLVLVDERNAWVYLAVAHREAAP